MKRAWFLASLVFAGAAFAAEPPRDLAREAVRESAQPPVVVELFTSQGCNTCPPADEYLGELVNRPGVLALAFHVDYWNYIGWNDPFAKPWATARQRQYRDSLKKRFVYTPEIVVNGAVEAVGSEKAVVDGLIREASAKPSPLASRPRLALSWRSDGALLVDVGSGESPADEPATLWLVGYDTKHVTNITRGENEGRTLTDYHPVRSYRRLGAWAGWSQQFVVSAGEAKALGDGGIAVIVQERGTGPILTAATIAP